MSPSIEINPKADGLPRVDISGVIDTASISIMQVTVFVLCSLVALLDGFDTLVIGFAGPAFASALHLNHAAVGAIFSAGTLGSALGALGLGALADRFGRKPVLIASTLLFSAFTIATAVAGSLDEMVVYRFFAGLGLGGATPSCLALTSEYAPRRLRGALTTLVWAAFPLGGIIGGVCASFVIPTAGWRPLFYFGGAFPVALCVAMIIFLRESPSFLLKKGTNIEHLANILRRIAPTRVPSQYRIVNDEPVLSGGLVRNLFTDGRTVITLLLWVFFFVTFMLLIVIALWSPSLLHEAGLSLSIAALLVTLNAVGSTVGVLIAGQLAARLALDVMLVVVLLMSAIFTALIGISVFSVALTGVCLTLGGFFAGATAGVLIALALTNYPPAMRSTGIGWAVAAGRLGQIVGPALGGLILLRNWTVAEVYLSAAVPSFCAACVAWVVWRTGRFVRDRSK